MRICKCILRKHTSRSVIVFSQPNKSHDASLIVVKNKIDQICGHICWSRFCWRSMATLSSAVTIKRRESRIFHYVAIAVANIEIYISMVANTVYLYTVVVQLDGSARICHCNRSTPDNVTIAYISGPLSLSCGALSSFRGPYLRNGAR